MDLDFPDTVDDAEVAAIATVFRTLAAEAESKKAQADGEATPDNWTFAGRIESLQDRRVRAPQNAPHDGWTAAGRTDRF
jgi:hypothetical protein